MKKIIFSIVGSMLISLCAVQAQQTDTEGAASKSKSKQNKYKTEQSRQSQQSQPGARSQDQKWQQQSDRAQGQDAYANEGMVVVDKGEIPASLRQKLQDKKYAGWENATIYHNTNTGEYVIAPRAYRFDSKGNEMEMAETSQGYSSRDRSGYSSGQQNNQSNQSNEYRSRDAQQQPSSQQQARDQMGEIPTSAPERADNADQQTEQNRTGNTNQQSGQNRTGDQSSANNQSATGDQAANRDESATGDEATTANHGTPASRTQDQSATGDQSGQSTQQTGDQANRDQQQSQSYRSTDRTQSDTQSQPGQTSGNQFRTEDMVEVQTEQIPASLRRTLRESQYTGWEEKGTLYQDPSTNEYVLVMDQTDDATQPRAYRFDKNGQVKEGEGTSRNNKQ